MGSIPGVGDGSPCQYYRLENPMDRGAWWAAAHRVAESWTQLSAHTQTHTVRRLLMESHTFAKISQSSTEEVSQLFTSTSRGAFPQK